METNRHLSSRKWASIAALALGGLCLGAGPGTPPPPPTLDATANQFPAITMPSEKRQQNFDLPGVVWKMTVKEGDKVKKGDVLAEQNTEPDKAHLSSLEVQSKTSDLEMQAAVATLDKDQVDLKRKETLMTTKSISQGEVDEARLQVKIDGFKKEAAAEGKNKAEADIAEQKARIEQKMLRAKIDGVVSEINTREGELANNDTQHPTVTVVKNDPLYVEVWLPAPLVTKLKADGLKTVLQVQYVDEQNGKWREAKIHFIRPQADAQSNMEYVQLEMPNPEGRSSGLQVMVRMPSGAAPAGAAAANR
jgi:RND family efflux transporter MFP subunit